MDDSLSLLPCPNPWLDPTLGYGAGCQHAKDGKPKRGSSPEYGAGYEAGKAALAKSPTPPEGSVS